jgi:D-tyrosyl-tRNA(Tyr) deacylase
MPLAEKILNLRVFAEGEKKFHLSTLETKAQVLLVSQFTLYADLSKGRRPDFFASLEAEKAKTLFDAFVELFRKLSPGVVQTGSFGASMQVNLENDGPATFLFEA